MRMCKESSTIRQSAQVHEHSQCAVSYDAFKKLKKGALLFLSR